MIKLDPWVYGPYELLNHAEGHLRAKKDFDRRMALISYDNAIELAISTFLQLHPSQRNGMTYQTKQVEEWLKNYHTKLEFFESYVKSQNQQMRIATADIVWCHKHRNELYHDGKGMVPEERILQNIRAAAFYIFSTLFNIDAEALLMTPPELNNTQEYIKQQQFMQGKPIHHKFQGQGKKAITGISLTLGLCTFHIKHTGQDFAYFHLLDEDGNIFKSLASQKGDYDISCAVGIKSAGTYIINAHSQGAWEIEIVQAS